jgi:hypothetical protein
VGWEEKIDSFNISTLMTPSRYKMSQKSILDRVIHQLDMPVKELAENVTAKEKVKKKSNVYPDNQRVLFFYYYSFNKAMLWKVAPSFPF